MQEIRVRFAPSPTGPLHIGGARSALFNYLFCRKKGGKFILRIEDTDLERSGRESELEIMESLRWLGMNWDEGVDCGGPFGPYRQTDRLDIYKKHYEHLLADGLAYHCYCSEEELQAERDAALAANAMPIYSGKCRNLTPEQKQEYEASGRKPTIRFHVPPNEILSIDDLVRGTVSFESSGVGDFVIAKSDGIPTYNFAVVVDDHLMQISHVIRAEEHLSNTPRQLALYRAFGWEIPTFAHISLILGEDRTKMSKRHGATSVIQYREEGYLSEAVTNFLALLGWSPDAEEEIFSLDELAERFELSRVSKRPAVFDIEKLKWLNGQYIRRKSAAELRDMVLPLLQKAELLPSEPSDAELAWAELLVEAVKEKVTSLSEIEGFLDIFTGEVRYESEEAIEVLNGELVPEVMNAFAAGIEEMDMVTADGIKTLIKQVGKDTGAKGKNLFMPLRVALTGRLQGPELHNVVPVLGRELTLERVRKAANN